MEIEGSLPLSLAGHLSLSSATSIQSMPPHPNSWRSILILSSHVRLGLQSGVFPSGSYQSPGPRFSLWTFRNMIRFYCEQLSAPRPTLKLQDHPLSAVRDCLFKIFASILHIGSRFSFRNLRTRHTVVTGTHLSRQAVSLADLAPSIFSQS